jgi:DNA-binding NtrC family response regulator
MHGSYGQLHNAHPAPKQAAHIACFRTGRIEQADGGTLLLTDRVALFERDIIVDALKRTGGNMTAAAREMKTTPRVLRYRLRQLDVDPKHYARSR